MTSITVLAPAKVNLFLQIIGRRDDGYHLLESFFAFADFGDKITVSDSDEISFSVTGPFAGICKLAKCDDLTNIAAQAGIGLKALADTNKGASIVLEKNLPLSAGLGGGSSDAAATLKALQVLWKVEVEEKRLFPFALELGADVPACLVGEPSFVTGIGEHITTIEDFPELFCLMVNPKKPLSTPAIFKAYAAGGLPFSTPLALTPEMNEGIWPLLEGTRNDLEIPAKNSNPEVSEILKVLDVQKGCRVARMSGSGASCFGLFEDEGEAVIAGVEIASKNPHWWVQGSRLSTKPPFLLHR